jgi:hypothetical protein
MGKRDDAVELLKGGLSPGQIRRKQGVSLTTILGYLEHMVGAGVIRRSDIFFSVPAAARHAVFSSFNSHKSRSTRPASVARRLGLDVDDVEVILRYKDERFALGDMYEDVRDIEVGLHRLIQRCLVEAYGEADDAWWRKGISVHIRQKCVSRREEDDGQLADPFGYADLVDLGSILEKNWHNIRDALPGETAADRKKLLTDLGRLNQIRKLVMHPVRGGVPSEDDFEFVRSLKRSLGFAKTR